MAFQSARAARPLFAAVSGAKAKLGSMRMAGSSSSSLYIQVRHKHEVLQGWDPLDDAAEMSNTLERALQNDGVVKDVGRRERYIKPNVVRRNQELDRIYKIKLHRLGRLMSAAESLTQETDEEIRDEKVFNEKLEDFHFRSYDAVDPKERL